jgi:hypothetical protein
MVDGCETYFVMRLCGLHDEEFVHDIGQFVQHDLQKVCVEGKLSKAVGRKRKK